jgi:mannose-6-phosphate isomerase-like protein (cupin superfamily)
MPRTASRIVSGLLIAIAACAGPAQADVVVLAGGDRITGVVKKLANGKLEFQSAYAADSLQIAWRDVTAITTDAQLQLILDDGTRPTGKLNGSPSGMTLMQSGAATLIRTAAILELQPLPSKDAERAPGPLHRLWNNSSVSADIDQSYSGLTQYNQFSYNSEIAYKGERAHRYEDQWFCALEGQFTFSLAGQTVEAACGQAMYVPRGTPYRCWNTGTVAGRVLVLAVPGGLDLFFAEIDAASQQEGLPAKSIQTILDKHGVTWLERLRAANTNRRRNNPDLSSLGEGRSNGWTISS